VDNIKANKTDEQKEIVRGLIRKSFPPLQDAWRMSHEDCIEMRLGLGSLEEENVPFFLQQILEDLLDTHTGILGNDEMASYVVQYLDVLGDEDPKSVREEYGDEAVEKLMEKMKEFISEDETRNTADFPKDAMLKMLEALAKGEDVLPNIDKSNFYDFRAAKLRAIDNFAQGMSFAVYKWLEYARTWPESLFAMNQIDAAMFFWASRFNPKP
jgi:hypothetical protein